MRTVIVVYASSGVYINTAEPGLQLEKMLPPVKRGAAVRDVPPERWDLLPATLRPLAPGVYRVVSTRAPSLSCNVTGGVVFAECRDGDSLRTIAEDTDVVIVSCEQDPTDENERIIVPEQPPRVPQGIDPATFGSSLRTFFWYDKAATKSAPSARTILPPAKVKPHRRPGTSSTPVESARVTARPSRGRGAGRRRASRSARVGDLRRG
jgi:hypothetical protein